MLEGIFGNKTAEIVLLYLYNYGEGFASGIAQDMERPITPVLKQLDRFESSGILVSKQAGRTRIYQINERYPFKNELLQLLKAAYNSIPVDERRKIFGKRRMPRRKGKVALNA